MSYRLDTSYEHLNPVLANSEQDHVERWFSFKVSKILNYSPVDTGAKEEFAFS